MSNVGLNLTSGLKKRKKEKTNKQTNKQTNKIKTVVNCATRDRV